MLLLTQISPGAPVAHATVAPELIFIDTDIGDDIDDAFAVALALQSPELHILGFSTTFGDTALRARLLDRLLAATGHSEIPVASGPKTVVKGVFTQQRYAERSPAPPTRQSATELLSAQIQEHPHQITLVALGPLTTVEAMIDRDPELFRQLKRVVMMGGSIDRGYGLPYSETSAHGPDAEWNILNGIAGARKLLNSGVPVVMLPLDATQLPLDEVERAAIFAYGSPLTDQLALLYHQYGQQTPTLFDPMTITYLLDPRICPTVPMRLRVDDAGYTRREPGEPNAQVCTTPDTAAFYKLLMTRLLAPPVSQ